MVEKPDLRALVREEVTNLLETLDIGAPGSDRRRDVLAAIQWAMEQKKRHEALKDRRRASLAGVGWGMVGTIAATAITWATGALQGLWNILTSGHLPR